jgi:hypothetical protein
VYFLDNDPNGRPARLLHQVARRTNTKLLAERTDDQPGDGGYDALPVNRRLNAVEGLFAKLTRQRLKRGVFQSVVDLQLAINRFVADPMPIPNHSFLNRRPKTRPRSSKARGQALESVH